MFPHLVFPIRSGVALLTPFCVAWQGSLFFAMRDRPGQSWQLRGQNREMLAWLSAEQLRYLRITDAAQPSRSTTEGEQHGENRL